MKQLYILLAIILTSNVILGQSDPKATIEGKLEVSGKVSQTDKPEEGGDLVTKSHMDSVLIKFVLMLDNGIQMLLNTGYTPKDIIDQGVLTGALRGKEFGGGFIVEIYSDGTGLVAWPYVFEEGQWGCQGDFIFTSSSVGSGLQNTNSIASACREPGVAARIAASTTVNNFDDWYLPSRDEFVLIQNVLGLGAYTGTEMWTSTQVDEIDAFSFNINTFTASPRRKSGVGGITLLRSF